MPYADFADPQSLNLYTYVRNIPTTRIDVDGHKSALVDFALDEVSAGFNAVANAVELSIKAGSRAAVSTVGVVLVVLTPTPAGQADEVEVARNISKNNQQQSQTQNQNNDKQQAEPKTATDGAGARSGGGRNGQKVNDKREQSAKNNLENLKKQRDELKSKSNKTPKDKEELEKVNKAINRELDRTKKSENHSQKDKR